MDNRELLPAHPGILIKKWRLARGLSQAQLAAVLGVSKKTVKAWEKGERTRLWPESVKKLVKVLRLSPEEKAELMDAVERAKNGRSATSTVDLLHGAEVDTPRNPARLVDVGSERDPPAALSTPRDERVGLVPPPFVADVRQVVLVPVPHQGDSGWNAPPAKQTLLDVGEPVALLSEDDVQDYVEGGAARDTLAPLPVRAVVSRAQERGVLEQAPAARSVDVGQPMPKRRRRQVVPRWVPRLRRITVSGAVMLLGLIGAIVVGQVADLHTARAPATAGLVGTTMTLPLCGHLTCPPSGVPTVTIALRYDLDPVHPLCAASLTRHGAEILPQRLSCTLLRCPGDRLPHAIHAVVLAPQGLSTARAPFDWVLEYRESGWTLRGFGGGILQDGSQLSPLVSLCP